MLTTYKCRECIFMCVFLDTVDEEAQRLYLADVARYVSESGHSVLARREGEERVISPTRKETE